MSPFPFISFSLFCLFLLAQPQGRLTRKDSLGENRVAREAAGQGAIVLSFRDRRKPLIGSFDNMVRIPAVMLVLLVLCSCARQAQDVENGVMTLDICGAKKIKAPSDRQIRDELTGLDTRNEDSFAILGPTEMTYIQVSGDKNEGFDLEYQEGAVDAHFRAKNKNITLDQIVEAFIAYRDGETSWRDGFDFEKITW